MAAHDDALFRRFNELANLSDSQRLLLQSPDEDRTSTDDQLMRLSVNDATTEINKMIQAEENEITKLRAHRATLNLSPHQIIHAHTTAYDALQSSTPYLPSFTNPLTILLAYRHTLSSITSTRSLIISTRQRIATQQAVLTRQQGALDFAVKINEELQRVVAELQSQNADERGRDELEERKLKEMDEQIRKCRRDRQRLQREFQAFVDGTLAKMIAVEELGGESVGSQLDADVLDEFLNPDGGKRKKKDREKGQRLITEIWGRKDGDVEMEGGRQEIDVVQAAGQEMKQLVEDLLNAALDDTSSSKWTQMERESAAARFLVRSYVAKLNPRDAKAMRLVDFGGKVEDG